MNTAIVADVLCRRIHPAEWSAPWPRRHPCADCCSHADALAAAHTLEGTPA